MRHLTRLYFDNSPSTTASDKYVALIDQGADSSGNHRFNQITGFLLTAADGVNALNALLRTHCFFKLPVGSSAIVDVYVPHGLRSGEPKTFDYQVFQSKNSSVSSEGRSQGIAEFVETLKESVGKEHQLGGRASGEPAGPCEAVGNEIPSGPSGLSVCSFHPSGPGPCGDQTEVDCPEGTDPLNAVADCHDGTLVCVMPEPISGVKKKQS